MKVSEKKAIKSRGNCERCGKEIVAGERYYEWAFFRQQHKHRQHESCGRPRASQLTQSKISGVYAAQEALDDGLANVTEPSDVVELLETAIYDAQAVADEYNESADNIEQSFPDSPTATECREKAEAIEEWIAELENAKSEAEGAQNDYDEAVKSIEEFEEVEGDEGDAEKPEGAEDGEDKESWEEKRDEALENAKSAASDAASSLSV